MKKVISILFCALLSACVKQEIYRGYNFDNSNFDHITIGKTTKDKVIEELGSPTMESDFGPDIMYYASAKYEKLGFLDPKLVEQRVLAFEFNKKGLLTNVTELDYDDFRNISSSDRLTEIKGSEQTPYQQIMSNIGKFKPKPKG